MTSRAPADSTLSPLFYVFAAGQQARSLLDVALRDAPLSAEEYAVYSALRQLDRVTPTVLARHVGMPVTTTLDALKVMTRRGHVSRSANPDDRRSYRVTLSAAGHRAHDATERAFSRVDLVLGEHLGAGRAALIDALAGLLDAGAATLDQLVGPAAEKATDPWYLVRIRASFAGDENPAGGRGRSRPPARQRV